MAFEKMGAFTFNHAEQPDELNVAADIAKANFDSRANELKTVLNKVVDLLNATTDGASGADNVGATAVDGLTGTTVQTILEELKTLVDAKETPTGAQAKANTAEEQAKTYADGQVGDLAGEGRTTETVKGNADAHIAHLADDMHIGKNPVCKIRHNANQSIPSGTYTQLYFNTTHYDPYNMKDSDNKGIIVPEDGVYLVVAVVAFLQNTTGERTAVVYLNETSIGRVRTVPNVSPYPTHIVVSAIHRMTAGGLVSIQVKHDAGSALDIPDFSFDSPTLTIVKVG